MKIRTDFVTNSSSSSFCTLHISASKLSEILSKYKTFFEKISGFEITNNEFIFEGSDTFEPNKAFPSSKDNIVSVLVNIIERLNNDVFFNFINIDCAYGHKTVEALISELNKNEKEICDTTNKFDLKCTTVGYGDQLADVDTEEYAKYLGLEEFDEDDWDEIYEKAWEKADEHQLTLNAVTEDVCSFDGKEFTSSHSFKVADH